MASSDGECCRAHRLAWRLSRGEIPYGMQVLHKCDNGLCINPDHLFLGTQKDNVDDCIRKGRFRRGEDTGTAKLTPRDVMKIRELHGKQSGYSVGRAYGVDPQTIYNIWNRKKWKHLPEGEEARG